MSEDVCRLCSKCDVTFVAVFDKGMDENLQEKIHVCFGILISEDDEITKKICKQCYFLINSYSELRTSAINNNNRLKKEYELKKKEKLEAHLSQKTVPNITQNFLPISSRNNSPDISQQGTSASTQTIAPVIYRNAEPTVSQTNVTKIFQIAPNLSKISAPVSSQCTVPIQFKIVTTKSSKNIIPDQIKNSAANVIQNSAPNLFRSTEPNVFKNAAPDVPTFSNPRLSNITALNLTQNNAANLSNSTTPDVPRNTVPKVLQNALLDVSSVFEPSLSKITALNLSQNNEPNLSKNSTPDVPKNTAPKVFQNAVPAVSSVCELNLSKNTALNLSQNRAPDLSKVFLNATSVVSSVLPNLPKNSAAILIQTSAKLPKSTTPGVPENIAPKVFQNAASDVSSDCNLSLSINSTTSLSQNSVPNLSKGTLDVSKNTASKVSENVSSNVCAPNVSKNSTTKLSPNSTSDLSKGTALDVSINMEVKYEVCENTAPDVSNACAPNVSKDSTTSLSQSSAPNLSKGTALDVPKITADDSDVVCAPKLSKSEAPGILQNSFLGALNLINAGGKSHKRNAKTRPKYHKSVRAIKECFPLIKIPTCCHQLNMYPLCKLDFNEIRRWKGRVSKNVWSVNQMDNHKPGVVFSRVKEKQPNDSVVSSKLSNPKLSSNSLDSDADKPMNILNLRCQPHVRLTRVNPDILKDFALHTDETSRSGEKRKSNDSDSVQKKKKKNSVTEKATASKQAGLELKLSFEEMEPADDNLLVSTSYESKTFICQTCNKVFDSARSLREHQKKHLKNSLQCYKCSQSFHIVEALITHNLTVHADEKVSQSDPNPALTSKPVLDIPAIEESQAATVNISVRNPNLTRRTGLAKKKTCQVQTYKNTRNTYNSENVTSNVSNQIDTIVLPKIISIPEDIVEKTTDYMTPKEPNINEHNSPISENECPTPKCNSPILLNDSPIPENDDLIAENDENKMEIFNINDSSNDGSVTAGVVEEYVISSDDEVEIVPTVLDPVETNGGKYRQMFKVALENTRTQLETEKLPLVVNTYSEVQEPASPLAHVIEDTVECYDAQNTPSVPSEASSSQDTNEESPVNVGPKKLVTQVNMSDEDLFLRYVFKKNLKAKHVGFHLVPNPKNKYDVKTRWTLNGVEELLRKTFIPVEFVPTNEETPTLKYVFTSNKHNTPKTNHYKWSIQDAITMPNLSTGASRTKPAILNKRTVQIAKKPSVPQLPVTTISNTSISSTIENDPQPSPCAPTPISQTVVTAATVIPPVVTTPNLYIQTAEGLRFVGQNNLVIGHMTQVREETEYQANPVFVLNNNQGQQVTASENVQPAKTKDTETEQINSYLANALNRAVPSQSHVSQPATSGVSSSSTHYLSYAHNVNMPVLSRPNIPAMNNDQRLYNALYNNVLQGHNPATRYTPTKKDSPLALMYQSVKQIERHTNVNIQNYVAINVPIVTNDFASSSSMVTNSNQLVQNTGLNTAQTISSTSEGSGLDKSKPLLRIKNISELRGDGQQSETNAGDRNMYQNMYVKTLQNYMQTCSTNPLAMQNNSDEYLQIS